MVDKWILYKFREIIACMIRNFAKFFNNIRPVYDGKRNMYTREPLPIGREKMEFEVCFIVLVMDFECDNNCSFNLSLESCHVIIYFLGDASG